MDIHIWGCGHSGRLGLNANYKLLRNCRPEPTLLGNLPDGGEKWTQVACGAFHTVALTKEGKVYTWGSNFRGQLGHGGNDTDLKYILTKVLSLEGLVVIKISCGYYHTAVVTDKGEMFTWGSYSTMHGTLGHNARIHGIKPRKVEALAGEMIVEFRCRCYHTWVVTSTGSIYTLGESGATGHHIKSSSVLPSLLGDLSSKGVTFVSATKKFTACITKAGEVFTWGDGSYGRLGHGHVSDQITPKRVESLLGVTAKQVACGSNHAAVCTEDGQVFTFGQGGRGQLGHGDREHKTSPGLVLALEGYHISQIQCGFFHSMALTSSGYVFTWGKGRGTTSCLGHGESKLKYITIPRLVEGLREHNVVQISSLCEHCGVLVDSSPSAIRQLQEVSFNNKEHSDVVIMVENEALYGNVDVLSQKSDYFAAIFALT